MNASESQKLKETEKKSETLILSKKNLLELISQKKLKTAKKYILELKNSNPKAEKYIKQVLQEIFCQKKVESATCYMYALVFYKNLIISGQLDYYEDNEFFPFQIHNEISKICEYNKDLTNIKQKGSDYFIKCIKIEQKQNLKEDLQALGTAVMIFAMELLQSIAEWYKEDYFTGEQSHFCKHYNQLLKKGIVFPKKSEYIYIKQQDKNEFEQNYLENFEMGEEQINKKLQSKNLNQEKPVPQPKKTDEVLNIKKTLSQQVPSLQSNTIKDKKAKQTGNYLIEGGSKVVQSKQNLNLTELKTSLAQKKPQTQNYTKDKAETKQTILSKLQEQKTQRQTQQITLPQVLKQTARKKETNLSTGSKIQNQPETKVQEFQHIVKLNSSLQLPNGLSQISKVTKNSQNLIELGSKQLVSNHKKQSQQPKLSQKGQTKQTNQLKQGLPPLKPFQTSKGSQQKPKTKNQQQFVTKNDKSQQKRELSPNDTILSAAIKKSFKRTQEATVRSFQPSLNVDRKEDDSILNQTTNYKHPSEPENMQRKKHRIFQNAPKSPNNTNFKPIEFGTKPDTKKTLNTVGISDNSLKLNLLSSNLSFSNQPVTEKKRDQINEDSFKVKKKSVPKTQKKLLNQTFIQNQDLAFKLGLTQKIFQDAHNKKSMERFPMKTLSAWRCQKQIKRDVSPNNKLTHQTLKQTLRRLKFKQVVLPFVPQYFQPITLKMYGLRKASLEIFSFTETSQVFFNNNIIQARLMKPAPNSYILSLLNVSRLPLKISLCDMKSTSYSNKIKYVGNSIGNDSKTTLNTGCYMDLPFSFQTSDLNFKFLTFDLEIDSRILALQLPITLLDQCNVKNGIQIDSVFNCAKKYAKIIKSQPFKLNQKELPKFLKTKKQKNIKGWQLTHQDNDDDLLSFTLKMKQQQSQFVNTLSCCFVPCDKTSHVHQLQIIFDAMYQETEAFAKVLVELLTFLLWD